MASRLALTTFAAVSDYWTERGWPRTPAHVRPSSRIDVPSDRSIVSAGPTVVAGVAWAPPQGVTKVEVSINGLGWRVAKLTSEVNANTWRRWRCDWSAQPGRHEIKVRTHGQRDAQPEHDAPPYPHGAGGCRTISVEVVTNNPLPAKTLSERSEDLVAEGSRRVRLASTGVASWVRHGFPRPRFEQADASLRATTLTR